MYEAVAIARCGFAVIAAHLPVLVWRIRHHAESILMRILAAVLLALCATQAWAEVRVNIEAPATPASTPAIYLLALNESGDTAQVTLPASLAARLASETRTWTVQLQAPQGAATVELAPNAFLRWRYEFTAPADAKGRLVLEVDEPSPARGMIELPGAPPATTAENSELAVARIERAFLARFALHEPIYFAYGRDIPAVKFQFSFKYRLSGSLSGTDATSGTRTPAPHGLYFAYTQRSLWDVDSQSSPFFDTSYMPELFYEWLGAAKTSAALPWFHWTALQVGARHESNGQEIPASRSLNIGYVRPAVVLGKLDGWNLTIAPRFKTYFSVADENRDIQRYRGDSDVQLVFGKNAGLKIGVATDTGKGNIQVDVTHPVRIPLIGLETYVLLQYFDGYGESLRTYNERSSTWRVGISFAR